MKCLMYLVIYIVLINHVFGEIRNSPFMNKLTKHIKPVGGWTKTIPLTEIPTPKSPQISGRRHLQDCRYIPEEHRVKEGGKIVIGNDYYDDKIEKKVVTVRMPEHLDHLHFEVTQQVPYLTVGGDIEAIGYHASTKRSMYPSECEKIYQEHLADQYSDEFSDQSEESLEMARMPINGETILETEYDPEKMYDDALN